MVLPSTFIVNRCTDRPTRPRLAALQIRERNSKALYSMPQYVACPQTRRTATRSPTFVGTLGRHRWTLDSTAVSALSLARPGCWSGCVGKRSVCSMVPRHCPPSAENLLKALKRGDVSPHQCPLSLSLVTMTHQYDSSRIGGGGRSTPSVFSPSLPPSIHPSLARTRTRALYVNILVADKRC